MSRYFLPRKSTQYNKTHSPIRKRTMPIKIPDTLPAFSVLEKENIFCMKEGRATKQDIRPLEIVILNLMPKKIETETQLLRILGNSPLQINLTLLQIGGHTPKNTSEEHLLEFYIGFESIKHRKFDGMIITGAPVEHLPFEQVNYWNELCQIMAWTETNVYSTFNICWASQASLYYHYGIDKQPLPQKQFGIFEHTIEHKNHPLLRGFDEFFMAPHSRHSTVPLDKVREHSALQVLSVSEKAGLYLAQSNDGRQIFVTGHSEYERDTLHNEYQRDVERGMAIQIPENYYPNNDPTQKPRISWRSHSNLLFTNWLNYYVYQQTPFNFIY